MKNVLLEIYFEELPAAFLPPAVENLKTLTKKYFLENKIEHKAFQVYATPRRLAIIIESVEEKTKEETVEVMGPPLRIAKDEHGNYTKAGIGFAQTQNVAPEKLKIKTTPKGDFLCIDKHTGGVATEKLLPEIFATIIGKLYFPKTMVWDESKFRFPRPIRNILALYGNKPLKLKIACVKSTNYTYGLYIKTPKKLKVSAPEKYLSLLRDNYVIASQEARKADIAKKVEKAAEKYGKALLNDKLLDEINFLVEHPSAIACDFDANFLKIPEVVIINCLEKKQKFFPVEGKNGKLTNCFIGIRNGASEYQAIIKEGYEKVAAARLKDAEFFFEQDKKEKLENKIEKLKGIVFQQKLGTVYDKVERVKKIAGFICGELKLNQNEISSINRTADLCKADLVTNMIFEYPELQGVMGSIYALNDGESKEVADGIEQHYWPLTAQGQLPVAKTGIVTALADKTDTITGNFVIGLIPTGSSDPYGLRRNAIGILRILLENNINIPLSSLADTSMGAYAHLASAAPDTKNKILEFFKQRLEIIFEEKGYKIDEIRAVLSKNWADSTLTDITRKLTALKEIRKLPDFEPLAAGFKRAGNILKQAQQKNIIIPAQLSAEKLAEPEEKELFEKLQAVIQEVKPYSEKKAYAEVLKILVTLREPIYKFFDKVMVMAPDTTLRDNRLALLKQTVDLFLDVADLSQLQ